MVAQASVRCSDPSPLTPHPCRSDPSPLTPDPFRPRGFTLVEVLSALAVLALGLSVIVAMFYGSFRQGQTASDRNAAAILIPEAVRMIEQEHLVTPETKTTYGLPADSVGLYVETLVNADVGDDAALYRDIKISNYNKPLGPSPAASKNVNEYPLRALKPMIVGGAQYRVQYRLEKHPEWWPHDVDGTYLPGDEIIESNYRGVYLLTLLCYRDSEGDMSRPVPAGDPVVVYLNDRKKR